MNQDKKIIWFFRHAQSEANANKEYKANEFSISLVPLSEFGFKQAEELPNHFSSPPDLIITSPFLRTKQTAEPVLKKYPNVLQEEWPIHEFVYLSLDRCFGTTIDERKPFSDEYWQNSNPFHLDGRGAERFVDFIDRAHNTIEMIKNRKEKFIVLFSHEFAIAAIGYILEKTPKEITSKEMREYREHLLSNRIPNATKIEFTF